MGAVGHLLVYVGTGLDFLDYLVYFFALGGYVTVSWIHTKVLCDWYRFWWLFWGFLHLLCLYFHCFGALIVGRKINPSISNALENLILSLFYLWLSLSLNLNLMWSSNLHLIFVSFLLLGFNPYLITIIKSISLSTSILAFICCLRAYIGFHSVSLLFVCFIVIMKAVLWFLLYFINLFKDVISFLLTLSLFLGYSIHLSELVLKTL